MTLKLGKAEFSHSEWSPKGGRSSYKKMNFLGVNLRKRAPQSHLWTAVAKVAANLGLKGRKAPRLAIPLAGPSPVAIMAPADGPGCEPPC